MAGVIDSRETIPMVNHNATEVSHRVLLYEVERMRHNPAGPRKGKETTVVAGKGGRHCGAETPLLQKSSLTMTCRQAA